MTDANDFAELGRAWRAQTPVLDVARLARGVRRRSARFAFWFALEIIVTMGAIAHTASALLDPAIAVLPKIWFTLMLAIVLGVQAWFLQLRLGLWKPLVETPAAMIDLESRRAAFALRYWRLTLVANAVLWLVCAMFALADAIFGLGMLHARGWIALLGFVGMIVLAGTWLSIRRMRRALRRHAQLRVLAAQLD